MILSKTKLFLLSLIVICIPFIAHKIIWLSTTEKAIGEMGFVGKSYTGTYVHSYSNIRFMAGKDTIWFNGTDNIFFKEGEEVPVRYEKSNPHNAKIDQFIPIWGDTIVYGGIPVIILLALFLHPQVIPRRTRIRLSVKKPRLVVLPPITI